jgi:hypothetical protein
VREQATERPGTQAHQQTFVTQSPREAALPILLPQALEFSVNAFRDSSKLIGDDDKAIAPACKRG